MHILITPKIYTIYHSLLLFIALTLFHSSLIRLCLPLAIGGIAWTTAPSSARPILAAQPCYCSLGGGRASVLPFESDIDHPPTPPL